MPNTQTSVPAFVASQVLTAQQQTEINTGIPVFATTVTRDAAFGGAGEKVLAEGQFAYIEATKSTQYYDGAAWQSVGVSPGLVLVKSQTIGTTVASVTVTGAFSTTYDSYLITVSGGVGSTEQTIGLQLGSTTTNYYMAGSVNNFSDGAATGVAGNNTAAFLRAGQGTSNGICLNVILQNPFLTNSTLISAQIVNTLTGGNAGNYGGWLNNSTSYTAFTLTPNTGTMTGGTIRVYGYANS
jgi:hypothetical protein